MIKLILRIMVWNMRWMTHYLGFIARPFVRWYADQEIIACGLRVDNSSIATIIYTPSSWCSEYLFFKRVNRNWVLARSEPVNNFSGNIVHQAKLTDSDIGDTYIVRAKKIKPNNKYGRTLRSPQIVIKEKTVILTDLITIDFLADGNAYFCWKNGEVYDPMIYFLVVEDSAGETLAGIYTRENFWRYPHIKKASLSIGIKNPPPFKHRQTYTIKLLLIDYDGWVSHRTEEKFIYI